MCVRIAAKRGIKLQSHFWNDNSWKLTYRKQILGANNLLKVYSFQAIINALELKTSQWICSLYWKGLSEIITREEEELIKEKKKFESMVKLEEKVEESQEKVSAKPFSSGKNKLKDLD